jgi:hypothetical protein
MPAILELFPFYKESTCDDAYNQITEEIQIKALEKTTHNPADPEKPTGLDKSLKSFISSTESLSSKLLECDQRNFQIEVIAILYARAFGVEFLSKHCKIYFYCKQNKPCSIGKSISMWSDTRRDSSIMASYWVEHFFSKIISNDSIKEAMNPLRSESAAKQESLYVMISCVSMILAGAKEKDPLSPVLAISKIYHEYLYYINSIVDNKHGIESDSINYETKVRDYTLASNLVLGKLKQYIKELQKTEFLNEDQFESIDLLFDQLNGEMMEVFKKDYETPISHYFNTELTQNEQEKILDYWVDHAVNMTGKWTEFFSIIGAISANQNFELTNCSLETIKAFGKIWGSGQLINGFKDFVVIDSIADDVREKRCTPQMLHLLFQASANSNNEDCDWIRLTIDKSSNLNSDLTQEEKYKFVELFKKYGTIEWIRAKCEKAITEFWQVYNNDTKLQDSLKSRDMNIKMKSMINGGLVSFFEQSRYLPR